LRLLFVLLELLFELRQVAILELRGLFVFAVFFGELNVAVQLFDFLAQLLHLPDGLFLVFPLRLHGLKGLAVLGQLLLKLRKARFRELIVLVFERGLFDLHLDDLAVDDVELGRHRVHLGADHCAGLVDEVDGLIGEEAVGNVPVRERRGGDDRGVCDLHAVEDLISRFQTTQNGDRIFHARLLHENRLEPPLERGVLFNILPVLVERCCADAMQFASCQHRLEKIARVH